MIGNYYSFKVEFAKSLYISVNLTNLLLTNHLGQYVYSISLFSFGLIFRPRFHGTAWSRHDIIDMYTVSRRMWPLNLR